MAFARFHQCVDNGTGFHAFGGIREQPVFAASSKRMDSVLGKTVGNIYLTVFQEREKVRFLVLGIRYRLCQLAARNGVQSFQPQPISLK